MNGESKSKAKKAKSNDCCAGCRPFEGTLKIPDQDSKRLPNTNPTRAQYAAGSARSAAARSDRTLGSDPSAEWSPGNGRSGSLHTKAARLAQGRNCIKEVIEILKRRTG
jgi:hypothetical protein